MLLPLHPELNEKLAVIRKRRGFQVSSWVESKIDVFIEWLHRTKITAAVLSLSGGIDSSVTLALLVETMKRPDCPLKKIVPIAQPIHSTLKIQNRAYTVSEHLGVDCITVDQTKLHDQLVSLVSASLGVEGGVFARGQLRSYQRTPVAYYVAQCLSQEGFPAIVVGTGNYDEDGYLRYFCKAGDGVVDLQLIADLHKSEVYDVGRYLGLPSLVVDAPPSADLWEGQTDEEELGFSYDFVELFTEWLQFSETEREEFFAGTSEEALSQFNSLGAKAEQIHKRNAHKVNFPVNLNVFNEKSLM
ncbi:hypothetical protein RCL1_003809 [Eukaryota sp. TZLM3-RCL]